MPATSEFEVLGHMTIGQYLPTGSLLHQLDPRVKLCMGLLLIVAVISCSSLIGQAILLAAVFAGLALARISLRFAIGGLRPMVPFLLLLALLQVFAIPQYSANATIIWRWSFLTMTDRSVLAGILLIARFAVAALGLSLFSFSTTTTELTHGIEHLVRPLQKFGFPAHELALVVNIAIRFLPILAKEAERLMKAQASRGADFGRGQHNFIRRTRSLLPLMVPLFLASLRRAEDLIEAMESRCYVGGKGRTHLVHMRSCPSDYFALFATLGIATVAIGLSVASADQFAWHWISAHFV